MSVSSEFGFDTCIQVPRLTVNNSKIFIQYYEGTKANINCLSSFTFLGYSLIFLVIILVIL
jgi:hypothetical protein